ncbi:MAG: gliding motility lipoprotein GldD [Chitinophagaceae bacterium]|nr:gliding motility lipoprotein GldD [Chitinophagaceae bacterium]
MKTILYYALSLHVLFLCSILFSCEEKYIQRARAYPRIELPPHTYQLFQNHYPYSFEHHTKSFIKKDSGWLSEPYWISIEYPHFSCWIQLTYKPINKNRPLDLEKYLNDSYKLTYKHKIKAYSIEESLIKLPNGSIASVSEIMGDTPTQFHFHTTDSTKHFLRGALYFNTSEKNDSLKPIIEYVKYDILHLLNTLKWK